MILVTGGTGFIGSYILYYLLKENASVKATRRPGSSDAQTRFIFRHLYRLEPYGGSAQTIFDRIEWVEADVLDIASLEQAMEGADIIYHAAAFISFRPSDHNAVVRTNVDGTANVVNAALEKGIKKIVYISSVAALAKKGSGSTTEAGRAEAGNFLNLYAESKYRAEMEIWRGHHEGLSAIIVNPAVVLGWGNFQTISSSIFQDIAKGMLRYPIGSKSYVDARDVARVIIQLSKRDDAFGEQFIIASSTLTYKELFTKIANALGVPAPVNPLNYVLSHAAWIASEMRSLIRRVRSFRAKGSAHVTRRWNSYSSEKLQKFLNYHFISIDKTIEDIAGAYKDWQSNGL